jgi:translation initiation factor 2-alpha kinase 4
MSSYLNVFLSIAGSVDYIHNDLNLIHRDLKPANIFLAQDNSIKLGDFGLTTSVYDTKYTRFERKNSVSSINSTTVSYHTKNVGTAMYAASEQLNDNYYDQKCDIFSLGLILFELVYPLRTAMEKHERFAELRKGSLPKAFQQRYAGLSRLILQMTDLDVNNRPDISGVIKAVESEISRFEDSLTLGFDISDIINSRDRFYSLDARDMISIKINGDDSDKEDSFILQFN